MEKQKSFAKYCTEILTEKLQKEEGALKWRSEIGPIEGERSSVDVWGENERLICLVELELSREDPVNNVAKIWRAIDQGEECLGSKNVLLVQVFSKKFLKNRAGTQNPPELNAKGKNATFVGAKMMREMAQSERSEEVEYKVLTLPFHPRDKDQMPRGDIEDALGDIAQAILSMV